ncbi:hemagglutinin repeat-containing protein [Rhizobium sp. 9T]|uniref:hemagglutinin repeat-containing protein n=1 Tax=Rhizobium croatiense TaxID=2867516 RepID=UPI001C93577F|nr:hemagglutinin repeat-containing protein [Rhizobium croatiense]
MRGQQNVTGSQVASGGALSIKATDDVNIIGSSAKAGTTLDVTADNGSVAVVSTATPIRLHQDPLHRPAIAAFSRHECNDQGRRRYQCHCHAGAVGIHRRQKIVVKAPGSNDITTAYPVP